MRSVCEEGTGLGGRGLLSPSWGTWSSRREISMALCLAAHNPDSWGLRGDWPLWWPGAGGLWPVMFSPLGLLSWSWLPQPMRTNCAIKKKCCKPAAKYSCYWHLNNINVKLNYVFKKGINTQNSPLCKFFPTLDCIPSAATLVAGLVARHCPASVPDSTFSHVSECKYSFPRSQQML